MEQTNKPIMSKRVGRFQVSTWVFKRLRKARHEFDCEREYEVVRACVQYSQFDYRSNKYLRQQIWCDPCELRSLYALLDGLGEEPELAGVQQTSLAKAVSGGA
jgi:hypothetical protein